MKEFFICECHLQENKIITSCFVVASKQGKPKKNGEPYLALTLADRTGQIEAKMWDNVEEFIGAFEQDDFLKIKGLINKYKNRYQLTIHKLRRLGDSEIDYTDYLPKTNKDIGELWRTLADFVATFQNPHLKGLVELFMSDPEIAERYRNAPAAIDWLCDAFGFGFTAEKHLHSPVGIELNHHAGHLIDNPDVVLRIDADLLGEHEAVDALSDLASEFPVSIELEQPRSSVRERPGTTE